MKTFLRSALVAGAALAALVTAAAAEDPIKFGYINKMGDHPWFVREVEGAKAKAKELGVELLVQDVQFDANLAVTTFDTYVGDGVKGIAIVVPDRALGPVVADKAKAAGIGLMAVDDDIVTSEGGAVPYVGLDAHSIGKQVGTEIARLYKEEGWASEIDKVRVGSIEDQKADTCMRRNAGAREALIAAVPELADKVISIPYDNTMVNAIDVVSTTLTAHPDAEKWIFFSCNDDGVLGGVRATENSGVDPKNVIGVGIDGSRSCEAFSAGTPTGFRGTMWLDSAKHGSAAIQALYDHVKNGTPLPEASYQDATLINAGNFGEYKATLGCK
ncbi:substrate-binding domain-containing protein [Prosthecomicrobium pneumaticum]|uniref:L-arabinose-binding periplasmic protein n=1 Tax=Prosthecomicrobium pneumaticum TaxID=81895 RepID=A0A7W9FNI4_9HYPH|nr:substrate-binding domain-containing protein [Prosthecomicrobium pneumaticum]MBB5753979.1 L-arabinose transport system substrate-binding protein [Prosthecomicrobium pneumaticum]